jgi:hypothetical protein
VDAAASARAVRAGRVVPVSPKPGADERRCQVRLANILAARVHTAVETLWHQANARTAKPCGPGRRRYGQAFAEVWSVQPDQPHRQFARQGRPEGIRLPGERGISRQHTAQGRPCVRLHLYAAVQFLCATCAQRTVGVRSAPGLPCTLLDQEGGETKQSSGEIRREIHWRVRTSRCELVIGDIAKYDAGARPINHRVHGRQRTLTIERAIFWSRLNIRQSPRRLRWTWPALSA